MENKTHVEKLVALLERRNDLDPRIIETAKIPAANISPEIGIDASITRSDGFPLAWGNYRQECRKNINLATF